MLATETGYGVERVCLSASGVPERFSFRDADDGGGTDSTDTTQIQTWIDTFDQTTITNNYVGTTLGRNNRSATGNRKGYAGYEWESQTGGYHVRNRILLPTLGRWNRRDVHMPIRTLPWLGI